MIGRALRTGPPDPYADEVIRERTVHAGLRWETVLVGYMRLLSVVWLIKGVLAWATIIDLVGAGPSFDDAAAGFQVAVICFAVIDLVAAVGLWLTSHWGGIVWMLAVMSHLIIAVLYPRVLSNSILILALLILSTMAYLTISWLAAIEEH